MTRKTAGSVLLVLLSLYFITCTSEQPAEKFEIRSGVNVSHWLSQSEKRGEERLAYITEADFAKIAAIGFDHVRIPVDEVQLWDSTGHREEEAFKLLHMAVKAALANKLRVIVDLHIIRSHYFNAKSNTLWTDPREQEKLADMWWQLSAELRRYPESMVAYELLNEAVADNPEDWNALVAKLIQQIRADEPERTLVIGSNRWQAASTFPDLRVPENDAHIILSYHFYTPFALTHHQAWWTDISEYAGPVNYPGQIVDTLVYHDLSPKAAGTMRTWANGYFDKARLEREMAPAIQYAREKKLPLYCGEFGVYPTIDNEIRLRYYQDLTDIFRANNIAYCHWCYKGDFPILDEKGEPDSKLVAILTAM
ncbi:MAG TPA: cellulase family glycosylhydrolase [bacterium]|nr:cellulase family glycosylhydrolase [bacterium]